MTGEHAWFAFPRHPALIREAVAARKSSDRAAHRLVWLTVVLVVLTAALVALTLVLAVRR
jgi:hypothetical protein